MLWNYFIAVSLDKTYLKFVFSKRNNNFCVFKKAIIFLEGYEHWKTSFSFSACDWVIVNLTVLVHFYPFFLSGNEHFSGNMETWVLLWLGKLKNKNGKKSHRESRALFSDFLKNWGNTIINVFFNVSFFHFDFSHRVGWGGVCNIWQVRF